MNTSAKEHIQPTVQEPGSTNLQFAQTTSPEVPDSQHSQKERVNKVDSKQHFTTTKLNVPKPSASKLRRTNKRKNVSQKNSDSSRKRKPKSLKATISAHVQNIVDEMIAGDKFELAMRRSRRHQKSKRKKL